uniref:Uncharacterized protein n=1 Tax=Setaria italica TaxID=4555 RepID=K3XNT7_SETIT
MVWLYSLHHLFVALQACFTTSHNLLWLSDRYTSQIAGCFGISKWKCLLLTIAGCFGISKWKCLLLTQVLLQVVLVFLNGSVYC